LDDPSLDGAEEDTALDGERVELPLVEGPTAAPERAVPVVTRRLTSAAPGLEGYLRRMHRGAAAREDKKRLAEALATGVLHLAKAAPEGEPIPQPGSAHAKQLQLQQQQYQQNRRGSGAGSSVVSGSVTFPSSSPESALIGDALPPPPLGRGQSQYYYPPHTLPQLQPQATGFGYGTTATAGGGDAPLSVSALINASQRQQQQQPHQPPPVSAPMARAATSTLSRPSGEAVPVTTASSASATSASPLRPTHAPAPAPASASTAITAGPSSTLPSHGHSSGHHMHFMSGTPPLMYVDVNITPQVRGLCLHN
jgi:hypothetical protein